MASVATDDEAVTAYVRWHKDRGLRPDTPARGCTEYDAERGGWILYNVRGELGIVTPDGDLLGPDGTPID